jgi:hypothetical protein
MPQTITTDLTRRLAFVRYLHGFGVDQSHKPEPFAAVAVLTFHDACEMFLQIAAEHNGITFPKQRSPDFLDYWPLFEQQAKLRVTSKASMSRLNRARGNLKHGGVLPVASRERSRGELGVDFAAPKGAEAARERLGANQAAQGCSRALASKVHPLLQIEWLLLPLREILFQAMLGAKLLRRRSVANETETATTGRATNLSLC